MKIKLKKFQNMQPHEATFESTIKDLMSTLSAHIADEERDDLPLLEDAITPEESERAAKEFERVKKWLPTRSHPYAPDKPVHYCSSLKSFKQDLLTSSLLRHLPPYWQLRWIGSVICSESFRRRKTRESVGRLDSDEHCQGSPV